MEFKRGTIIFLLIGLLAVFLFGTFSIAVPDGADNTAANSSGRVVAVAESLPAIAGNVTEADFSGVSTTRFWQGFFGNVSGVITLEDGGANVIYNWTATNPRGEIYAANGTSTINWLTVQCLNFTANGSRDGVPQAGTAGDYNLNGMNLSELHKAFGFNITGLSPDNVSATFKESNTHEQFYTGALTFSAAECPTAYIFGNTEKSTVGEFEEVLMWDPSNNATIWTSILEDNLAGFDQKLHDFEMLVLENGAGTEGTTTTYFWLELQ